MTGAEAPVAASVPRLRDRWLAVAVEEDGPHIVHTSGLASRFPTVCTTGADATGRVWTYSTNCSSSPCVDRLLSDRTNE